MCETFEKEGVVCPPKLLNNVFTTAAVDNIDHNPSSTTATDSFHGTGISIMQHPTDMQPGIPREVQLIDPANTARKSISKLPDSYTNVPPAVLNSKDVFVPPILGPVRPHGAPKRDSLSSEYEWLTHVRTLLDKADVEKYDFLSWAAFHASLKQPLIQHTTNIALMPLFLDNAHSAAMILHSMNMIEKVVHHLNPQQMPVIAMDQPLYALTKQIQWIQPEHNGEDNCIIMLGGLHIEMAAFNTLGDCTGDESWNSVLYVKATCRCNNIII